MHVYLLIPAKQWHFRAYECKKKKHVTKKKSYGIISLSENQSPSRTKRPERKSSSLVIIILISAGGVITLALLMLICGAIRKFRFSSNVNGNDHE